MKKKFTFLIAALFALMLITLPGMVMGQNRTSVTLWSEDFTGATSDAAITSPTNSTYSNVTYTCTNGAGTSPGSTVVKNENLAKGDTSPELMVGKKGSGNGAAGGKFTAVIPLDNIEGTLTLTYYQNKQSLKVSSTTTGVSGGQTLKPSEAGQQSTTFTGVTTSMTSITIVFEATTTNNVRLDDIVLTGTQAAPVGPTQLAVPTNFDATAGNGQATFSWTAVEHASSYTIAYTPAGGSEQTVTGITGTSRIITGLTNGTEYTCKIKAVGDGTSYSDSEYSSTKTVTPTGANYYNVTISSTIIGGSVSASPASATEETPVTLIATPGDGYRFNNTESNWSVSPTTTITPGENNTATFVMPNSDVTVSATFTPYTVTLNAGNGTIGSGSDHTQTWDVSMNSGNLPNAISACDTWTFEGWSTVNVGTQTDTRPTTIVDIHYVPTANIALYAVYKKTEEGPDPVAFTVGSTGDYVVAAYCNNKYYALPANPTVSSGKIDGVEITVNTKNSVKYVETANASGYKWTIASATYGYTLYDGTNYIFHSNGGNSGTNLAIGTTASYTWSFTDMNGGYIKFFGMVESTKKDRGMLYNGTAFGGYAMSNWGESSYYNTMILPIVDGTKSYYISNPDCREQAATPVITLAAGSYTSDQTTTITCETTEATIYYTTDGTDPTDASTEYTGAITIDRSMTIKAIAIHEDYSDSNIASAIYVLPRVFANIAAFKDAFSENSTEIVKITGPLTTVYHNGKNLYVQDNTGSMLVYDSDGNIITRTYENGQTVSNIYGKYEKYNGLIEFIPDRDFSSPGEGTAVEPTDIASLTSGDYSTYDAKLVRLSNMMFTADHTFSKGTSDNASMDDDDYNTVVVRSRFKTLDGKINETDMANVVGFVGINNTAIQLYPRDNNDIQYILETMEVDVEKTINFAAILNVGEIIEIKNGGIFTIEGTFTNEGDIMIDDGGQFVVNNSVEATVYKSINGWNTTNWYFISSPIGDVAPSNVTGMITDNLGNTATEETATYDLYSLDITAALGWQNYRQHNFSLVKGMGYLYASKAGTTLNFTGNIQPSNTNVTVSGLKDGFNLVGNPFTCVAYLDQSYYMLVDGNTISASTTGPSNSIAPCLGVIINGTSVTFSKTKQTDGSANNGNLELTLTQAGANTNTRGESSSKTLDNAIVSFNEGSKLGKFYFGTQNANIYIPMDNEEYAIVSSNAQGEMPVNFKAHRDGQYTITVNPEEVEMGYLHLIDNIAGKDVDLLANPSYSFNARTDDYESRFRLVFSTTMVNAEMGEDFAFISDGQLVIANVGEAILQVIDVTGRVVANENINGTCSKAISAKAGVYVLRLINGTDVKTQKIVIR